MTTSPDSARAGSLRGALLLLLAALLWGSTVVAIKQINIPPSFLNFGRFMLAAVALAPFAARRDKRIWNAGLELSVWLFIAYASQAIGLKYTTVNRSAFITALNVIFVPIISRMLGKKIGPLAWAAALTALLGCGLLCNDGKPPNIGDAWTLVTAITWATYIIRVESRAQSMPALSLALSQLAPMVAMSFVWAMADHSFPTHLPQNFPWWSLLYLGLPTTAGTIWLQSAGQKTVPPAQTAVIFTLEPVFAAICAYIFMHEILGFTGMIGAALIIVAAIVSQLPTILQRRP